MNTGPGLRLRPESAPKGPHGSPWDPMNPFCQFGPLEALLPLGWRFFCLEGHSGQFGALGGHLMIFLFCWQMKGYLDISGLPKHFGVYLDTVGVYINS